MLRENLHPNLEQAIAELRPPDGLSLAEKVVLGVLGGDRLPPERLKGFVGSADYVIAADSGLLRLIAIGEAANCVVGDFDSLNEVIASRPSLLDHVRALQADFGQDDTDCAKLLRWAHSVGARTMILTCLEGDLLDHTLDALHTCARLADLFGGQIQIGLSRGFGYVLNARPEEREFATQPGARVSLLPLSGPVRASMIGTRWPVENQTLEPTGFTSISNEANGSTVTVRIGQGSAFLFVGEL